MNSCPVSNISIPGRPVVGRFPVPYVAMWRSEISTERVGICPVQKITAVICDETPDGVIPGDAPEFGRMHPVRQRRCVLKRLCSVCGLRIHRHIATREIGYLPWFTRNGDDAGASIHGAIGNGEPMTCARCCVFSLTLCPGLGKMKDSIAGLLVIRMQEHDIVSARMGLNEGEEHRVDADVPRRADGSFDTVDGRALGMLKIRPLRYRAEFAEDFIDSMKRRGIAC